MNWTAHSQSKSFHTGCEVDFVIPVIKNEAPLTISSGDEVTIEWPQGGGDSAVITEIDDKLMRLKLGVQEHVLRVAIDTDNINPIQAEGMDVQPWIVVE